MARAPKPKQLPFGHKLVLNQWIVSLFGYDPLLQHNRGHKSLKPFKPFADMLSTKADGLDADNLHRFYKHLDLELQEGAADGSDRFEKLLNVKDRGKIFRVEVESIEHIEAAGDYMCIYTGDNSLILRETMKDLERRLDPRKFQRVHRSTIVNLDQVRQVKPHTNGECFLVLSSGAEVKVSRSYRDVVARFVH